MAYGRSVGKKKNWNIRRGDMSDELRNIANRVGLGDFLKDHIPGKHGAAQKGNGRCSDDVFESDQPGL